MDSKKYFWLIGIVIVVLVIGLIIGVTISGAAFRLLSWSGEESKTVDSLLKKDTLTTSDTEKTCSEYGRIILKVSNTKKYAIWAETVPPSIDEGAGVLKIPLVERKHKGGVSGYDYLQFTRLKGDITERPEDIIIHLAEDPEITGYIKIPYNGGHAPDTVTIKLNTN